MKRHDEGFWETYKEHAILVAKSRSWRNNWNERRRVMAADGRALMRKYVGCAGEFAEDRPIGRLILPGAPAKPAPLLFRGTEAAEPRTWEDRAFDKMGITLVLVIGFEVGQLLYVLVQSMLGF